MIINNPQHMMPLFQYVRKIAPTFKKITTCTETIPVVSGGVTSYRNLFQNQIDYLKGEPGDWKTAVSFIGRFETLCEPLSELLSRCGLPEDSIDKFPHHRHGSVHRHYTEYYDPGLRDHVGELYARDIEAFGYQFGS